MERLEQAEDLRKPEQQPAAELLLEAVSSRPAPLNIAKESQRIADLFDNNRQKEDESYSDRIVKGSIALSSDLQRLTGNKGDYNKLLKEVADKIPDEPAMNPSLRFSRNGKDIRNPDNADAVYVMSGDSLPAYRIVQPGNTFNQIARDAYNEIVKAAGGEDEFKSFEEYKNDLYQLNLIETPNIIHVGQAIRLRDSFAWS